jgi:hypothetical protein
MVRIGGWRKKVLAAAALLAASLAGAAQAQQAAGPKWGPHIDLEGKVGTKRNLGESDLFIPLAQDADTLLFSNLRARLDDNDDAEGNFGLGLRHMLENGWNLGTYAYLDRRKTEWDHYFSQVTLGLEALSFDWDLRGNLYLPQGRRTHQVDALNTAEVSGTSVIFRGGEEKALSGFDAEIGWRVPVFDAAAAQQLRIYGGGYRFTADDVPNVQGPRGRFELTFDSVPGLWQGSRLSFSGEIEHDEPRGTQVFTGLRLRIPLQIFGRPSSDLTPMERRMADPVVRDVDIVSQAGTSGRAEVATQLADGGSFTVINSATTAGNTLATAVAVAGNNSTVLLAGSFQVTGSNVVSLAIGQTLTGVATVRNADGRLATVNTGAQIQGTNMSGAGGATVQVNAGGTLTGLAISSNFNNGSGGSAVLVGSTAGNVTIANSTISITQSGNNAAAALTFSNGANGTVSGNVLAATGSGAATTMTALGLGTAGSVTVTGNMMSAAGGATNNIANVAAATVNAGSTGNIRGAGVCTGTPASGFIGFTDGSTCP